MKIFILFLVLIVPVSAFAFGGCDVVSCTKTTNSDGSVIATIQCLKPEGLPSEWFQSEQVMRFRSFGDMVSLDPDFLVCEEE